MTIDQLEALEAIVAKGSFKAAAEALHKTQPSLSVAIKKLEDEFSIELFNREKYRPELTVQGQIFLNWARQCLDSFRALEVIGKELGTHQMEPRITVVVDPLARFESLNAIFHQCLVGAKSTELVFRSEILDAGMLSLLDGTTDFAIASQEKQHKDIESIFFENIKLIPVCSNVHLNKKSKIGLQDLLDIPHIVVSTDQQKKSQYPGKTCFVTNHEMKKKLILEGFGWGRLAEYEVQGASLNNHLYKIEDPHVEPIELNLYIMRNKLKPMGPISKIIWQNFLDQK